MKYYVVRYQHGQFDSVMAGLGRNRRTWDTAHSRRTAQRHATSLRKEQPGFSFAVESLYL